ncbi:TetR/AcrR family transcriptional regulator [Microbacterium ulmi]|uniref:TetR/AcrR family transcriptional regulator n=1 Tax=Microbacterium ulmi TaxID=179095 RepID=A0A7Y2M1L8_9MICO|nr:TetR/AcrR family transcriptional regulator [Microbacterium ulmi]NII70049.1 AcrR family transcriptional regulator [Microbacterium ulmi]NNH04851.1 TetR/AcrR family transcriptional regulator [Microbacterium ulmi]
MTATAAAAPSDAPARRGRPGYDRAAILGIAVTLFNEQGYDATSVADLAARLGVTKSALYHHFSSRDELLEQALDVALGGLEGVLAEPAATEGTPAERLDAVLRGAVRVLVDRLPYVTLLLRVRGNSDVERAALARRRAFDQAVTTLVREAQDAGLVRRDIDGAVTTRLVFGMINSLVEWYRPAGAIDRDRLTHDIVTIALDGMRTR